ncbi:CBS domain-containing protein [Sedimentitalea todarodis]|uniref:CBS domain-containing protein n=1 Tax=Sedimentitalea todarodis TaxID=1631240 RepID=A0ABU3VGS4_9RHOB|nr:CBS domain-containing protein [Sedimentitalea todarodis]MDU9005370.1 CBS domain-containing protein [Sedimentitalea todarodis]
MAPTSYQGRMEKDDKDSHTHSQTEEWSLGVNSPGIKVEDILRHKGDDVHSVTPHSPVREAVGKLTRMRIGALVVVNSDLEPVGIVSERDIVHMIDAGKDVDAAVETIMTPNPVTCTPDYTIEEVMKVMSNRGFRHMPVQQDGHLVGLVSVRDVVKHRLQEVEYENLKIKQAMVG